jgi:hypothetical protein
MTLKSLSFLSILVLFSCGTKKDNSTKPSGGTSELSYINNAKLLNDNTYLLTKMSKDKNYAFTPEKAVFV